MMRYCIYGIQGEHSFLRCTNSGDMPEEIIRCFRGLLFERCDMSDACNTIMQAVYFKEVA